MNLVCKIDSQSFPLLILLQMHRTSTQIPIEMLVFMTLIVSLNCACASSCSYCIYKAGSYSCQCAAGYTLVSSKCYPNSNESSDSSSSSDSGIAIVAIIMGSVGGCTLCCIVCCCCSAYKKRNEEAAQRARQEPRNSEESATKIIKPIIPTPAKEGIWLDSGEKLNCNETCCICLDKKISLKTHCGHLFHPKCISEWFKKQANCPLCKATTTFPSQIYCQNCNRCHLQLDGTLLEAIVKDGKILDCQYCKMNF